ncbi:tRNA pseudouridine(55) synthase TruB [Croceicoccus sediminis]|uniref:tRNA pseudouridine(55) synthase TruB n=1 Tax=Croceicoccus sediminis TaxID=2571150 RepID=UPI001F107C2E|nr:tRNA pseudouridine(55) synthase TruB [Croceicoccus sediminis]
MPNGWIILDKPLELGSTQAVAAVKRNLRQAGFGKVKVGHGGTLDPLATGVLPIAVGEATKLAGRMLDATKVYAFTLAFGAQTSTLDAEGEVVATSDVRPTRDEIAAVLPRFTGPIEQVPPAYSALKIDGKRAYDLARAGEDVEMKTRSVTIHALDVTDAGPDSVTLVAKVSKGTYIRSLARDIALALGSVGHVTMLRRVKAGPFTLENAISLDKLNELGKGAPLEDMILPLEAGLDDIPALVLSPDAAGAVRQGRKLSGLPEPDGTYWGREGDKPVALMEVTDGEARVLRGFNL